MNFVGFGIFIFFKGVLVGIGFVGLSLFVWVGCGIISLFGKVIVLWVKGKYVIIIEN